MPNNNGIYNAAIAGTLAAFTSRWITNISASSYQTQVLVAVAFANQVDSLIPAASYDEGSYRVMESICNAFWTDRNPTSVNPQEYLQGASALVAVFNQVQSSLASEATIPASDVSYAPNPAFWPILPTTVQEALDITAGRDAALETDVSTLQNSLPQDAVDTPYTPTTAADWAIPPTEVASALDLLADTRGELNAAGALGASASIQYAMPAYTRKKSGLLLAWGQMCGTVSTAATITVTLSFADNAAPAVLSTVAGTMVSGGNWCLNTFSLFQATQSTGLQWILDGTTSAGTISSAAGRSRILMIEL